jgi:glycosyltransferase involved in cell wall biosynthesis
MKQKVKNDIIFSVIMPTFNSDKTIEKALMSIRNQDYDQSKIEILVIDGGSTDNTIKIAKQYNSEIIINPKRLPEIAKEIGIKIAKGKYFVFQDSDEEIIVKDSYKIREEIFLNHLSVNNIIPLGLINPKGYSRFSEYTNVVGDPFSYFMRRQDGSDLYLSYIKRLDTLVENNDYAIFQGNNTTQPILDAGGHTVRKPIIDSFESVFIDSFNFSKQFAVLKNSFTNHYSTSTFKGIINKIKFRVKNNLSQSNTAGFINRESQDTSIKVKKYLFFPYTMLVIPVLIDAIILTVRKKSLVFMLLPIFSFITVIFILYYMINKPKEVLQYGI